MDIISGTLPQKAWLRSWAVSLSADGRAALQQPAGIHYFAVAVQHRVGARCCKIARQPELRENCGATRTACITASLSWVILLGLRISPVVPVMIGLEGGRPAFLARADCPRRVRESAPRRAPAGVTLLRCSVNAAHSVMKK